jgi:hypothetical protein
MIGTVTDFIVGRNLSLFVILQIGAFAGRHTKRASELSVIPFCRLKTARSEKLMRVRAATTATA